MCASTSGLELTLCELLKHLDERLGLLRARDAILVVDDGERHAADPSQLGLPDARLHLGEELVGREEGLGVGLGGEDARRDGVAREEVVRAWVARLFEVGLEQPACVRVDVSAPHERLEDREEGGTHRSTSASWPSSPLSWYAFSMMR